MILDEAYLCMPLFRKHIFLSKTSASRFTCLHIIPVVPHKAVAEVSEIGNLIGEVGCCESRMAERIHWWTDRWLRSPLFLSFFLSFSDYLPTYLPTLSLCLSTYLSIYLSIYLSSYLSIYLSIHPSVCLSIYLSIHLSISLSLCLSVCLSTCLSASLKTNLFCETSSGFKLDNIKNGAILRDVFIFQSWQHQKRSNSARLLHFSNLTTSKTRQFCETSFKNGKLHAHWRHRANAFCDFSSPPV